MTNNFFIWLWHSGNWRTDAITCDPNNVLLYVNTLTQSAVIISFTKIITNILCMYLIQFVFLFGCNCTILFSIWFPLIGIVHHTIRSIDMELMLIIRALLACVNSKSSADRRCVSVAIAQSPSKDDLRFLQALAWEERHTLQITWYLLYPHISLDASSTARTPE